MKLILKVLLFYIIIILFLVVTGNNNLKKFYKPGRLECKKYKTTCYFADHTGPISQEECEKESCVWVTDK